MEEGLLSSVALIFELWSLGVSRILSVNGGSIISGHGHEEEGTTDTVLTHVTCFVAGGNSKVATKQ